MSPAVRPNFAVGAAERLDQVLADEIDLGLGLGLRIGDQHDLEGVRLVLRFEREIERSRQRPGRRDPLEGEIERGRRAVRAVMAVEARQVRRGIDGRHVARRLDDEDRRLVRQGQRVAAVAVRDGDVAAVRDEDAGKPGIGGAGRARTVPILEHDPRDLGASVACACDDLTTPRAQGRPPRRSKHRAG